MKNSVFGSHLTALMKEKGISQSFLALCCNTTQQTVSRWCNGLNEPDIENIKIICAVLEENPSTLFQYDEKDAPFLLMQKICFVVEHSKEFLKAQNKLVDKLEAENVTGSKIDEACEELFGEYIRRFLKEYGYPTSYNDIFQRYIKDLK